MHSKSGIFLPYQSTEQIEISPSAERHIPHVTDDNLLGHFRGTVQDYVFVGPATEILQDAHKRDGIGRVHDPLHVLHLE